jgi:hypothetical protein
MKSIGLRASRSDRSRGDPQGPQLPGAGDRALSTPDASPSGARVLHSNTGGGSASDADYRCFQPAASCHNEPRGGGHLCPWPTTNNCVHLTGGSVTAPAEKHRRQDRHLGLPGPRRDTPAGDAYVSRELWP